MTTPSLCRYETLIDAVHCILKGWLHMQRFLLLLLACAMPIAAQEIQRDDFVKRQSDGILIQDPDAPISFHPPKGWVLSKGQRWGDHETTLWFEDANSHLIFTLYYQYPLNPKTKIDAVTALRQAIDAKVNQRRESEGIADYHVREGSIQNLEVAGHPAMSYIGEFTQKDGAASREYMLRVLGNDAKGHFFVLMPATADLDGAMKTIGAAATTLRLP